jgi:hypothetical protein
MTNRSPMRKTIAMAPPREWYRIPRRPCPIRRCYVAGHKGRVRYGCQGQTIYRQTQLIAPAANPELVGCNSLIDGIRELVLTITRQDSDLAASTLIFADGVKTVAANQE